jgi:adenylate cyclase
LSYLSATAVRLFTGERKIVEIRRMFSSYVSKKVVDELIKDPEKAKLGGQVKEVTIIFSDLKGFTSYSEKNTPQQVVSTLNEYFAVMAECIIEYNGTLDKFLGDGIMAFWNAPVDQEKHPELALRCALEMSRRFERLQKKWMSESRELLDYGIGINIGDVIVGNVGVSGKKMEYTAIGDTVNVTHRVQDQTRIFKRNIIITEKFFEKIRDIVDTEELGPVTLKGKEEPVTLLAVTGLKRS